MSVLSAERRQAWETRHLAIVHMTPPLGPRNGFGFGSPPSIGDARSEDRPFAEPSTAWSCRCKAAATTTRYIFLDQLGEAGVRREAEAPPESAERASAPKAGAFLFQTRRVMFRCWLTSPPIRRGGLKVGVMTMSAVWRQAWEGFSPA